MGKLSEKYVAGFFDGDGSLGVDFHVRPNGRVKPYLVTNFTQKTSQDEVIHRIHDEYGGSVHVRRVGGGEYSTLTLAHAASLRLMSRMRKFQVIKRHYTEVCLDLAGRDTIPQSEVPAAKEHLKIHRKQRALPIPKHHTRGWLAGYFDADGCLSVGRISRFGQASMIFTIATALYDTEGLEVLQKNLGGKLYPMRNGRCQQWRLALPPSKALAVLPDLAKRSIVKADQLNFILECAKMGHYRDGKRIKLALKTLKAHPHRLNEPKPDIASMVQEVQDLPPMDLGLSRRNNRVMRQSK